MTIFVPMLNLGIGAMMLFNAMESTKCGSRWASMAFCILAALNLIIAGVVLGDLI